MLIETAAAAAAFLAPYMPALIQAAGEKVVAQVVDRGSDAAVQTAQAIWSKLKARFQDDDELLSAAKMVATKPEDEARQSLLGEIIGERLKEDPELASEIAELLGGRQGVQRVLAEHESVAEDVAQRMQGTGEQHVEARDKSQVRRIRQDLG